MQRHRRRQRRRQIGREHAQVGLGEALQRRLGIGTERDERTGHVTWRIRTTGFAPRGLGRTEQSRRFGRITEQGEAAHPVGPLRSTRQRLGPHGRGEDRWSAVLHRWRTHRFTVGGRPALPEAPKFVHRSVQATVTSGKRRAEGRIVLLPAAHTDRDLDPTSRHDVERGQFLGDQGRSVPGQHHDVDQNSHPGREGSGRRAQGETVQVVKRDALTGRHAGERPLVDSSAPGQQTIPIEAGGHLGQGHADGHPRALTGRILHSSTLADPGGDSQVHQGFPRI